MGAEISVEYPPFLNRPPARVVLEQPTSPRRLRSWTRARASIIRATSPPSRSAFMALPLHGTSPSPNTTTNPRDLFPMSPATTDVDAERDFLTTHMTETTYLLASETAKASLSTPTSPILRASLPTSVITSAPWYLEEQPAKHEAKSHSESMTSTNDQGEHEPEDETRPGDANHVKSLRDDLPNPEFSSKEFVDEELEGKESAADKSSVERRDEATAEASTPKPKHQQERLRYTELDGATMTVQQYQQCEYPFGLRSEVAADSTLVWVMDVVITPEQAPIRLPVPLLPKTPRPIPPPQHVFVNSLHFEDEVVRTANTYGEVRERQLADASEQPLYMGRCSTTRTSGVGGSASVLGSSASGSSHEVAIGDGEDRDSPGEAEDVGDDASLDISEEPDDEEVDSSNGGVLKDATLERKMVDSRPIRARSHSATAPGVHQDQLDSDEDDLSRVSFSTPVPRRSIPDSVPPALGYLNRHEKLIDSGTPGRPIQWGRPPDSAGFWGRLVGAANAVVRGTTRTATDAGKCHLLHIMFNCVNVLILLHDSGFEVGGRVVRGAPLLERSRMTRSFQEGGLQSSLEDQETLESESEGSENEM